MNNFRFALRQLYRNAGFSAAAIGALAGGIGASTAMFGVLYAFLLRPLPFANPERLVMLQSRDTQTGRDLGVNYRDFRDWKGQARSFTEMAFFNLRWNGNLESLAGGTETLKTTLTTANLFDLLGVSPVLGRNLLPADDEAAASKVMLISHRLWQRSFGGDIGIIGRNISLDGTPREVVGVMPPGFRFPSQSDIWVPMAAIFEKSIDRSWRADQAIGRLRDGVAMSEAQAELKVIAERLAQRHPETNKDVGAAVVALREHWTGPVRPSIFLLFGACGSLLLIACANVSQLLLARGVARAREFSVRAALGASRAQIARQLLAESALLTGAGGLGGILLAHWLVDFVATTIPAELPFWLTIDVNLSVLAFTVGISAAAALLTGSLPAWQATRLGLASGLRSHGAGGTGGSSRSGGGRELLLVSQIAISLVLLVGASLVLRSVLKLDEVDPGFDARNVLMLEANPTYRAEESNRTRIDRFVRLLDRIAQLPGVEAVAANNSPPFVPQRPWNRVKLIAEHQSIDEQNRNPHANFQTISPDYFRVLSLPLRGGRVFDARDNLEAPRVCIISDRLAQRLWPGAEAIGLRLRIGGQGDPESTWMTVVGVVGDVKHQALEGDAGPDLYQPSLQLAWKQMHLLIRLRDGVAPMNLVPVLQKDLAAFAPEVGLFNFVALGDEVANSIWQQRLRGWLLGFFSIVALALAATGLYGSMAQGVTQRTREIGIRMALGATRASVLRLVAGQGMRAVCVGVMLGLVGAFLVGQILRASLFGVTAFDLLSYLAACLLLALTAAIACLVPARRAARVEPMEALRHE